MNISHTDRAILRDTAKQMAELAASERNQRLRREWEAYGNTKTPARPMIRIEINRFAHEILPAMQRCEGEEARAIEANMLRPMANFTLFEDDTLVPAFYHIGDHRHFRPFGLPVRRQETAEGVGHHFIPYLHELEADDHLLGPSEYGMDEAGAQRELEEMQELLGDILPVRRGGSCIGSCMMQDIVHIMNMDDMYVAMIDEEDRFRAMMQRLTDDYIAYFTLLERSGTLRSAAGAQHLNQGTYCFTNELPDEIEGARLKDMWLFMDAQETSSISPDMYRELVFPYYRQIMERFGLVSYGCCEPVHPIWDSCLSTVKNLRKVSISAWCDEETMGERLRGTGITYLRKPPATIVGMPGALDEEAALACFRKTAKAAKGCKLEIAQREVYQVGGSAEKVHRYIELARIALNA